MIDMMALMKPSLPLLVSLLLTLIAATSGAEDQMVRNLHAALQDLGYGTRFPSNSSCHHPDATIFIPIDDDYDYGNTNTNAELRRFLRKAYHIVPQRLSFSDLQNLAINTRIPTLLRGFSLLVTNNSLSNYSIHGVTITHPNLFQTATLSAHGVAAPFDTFYLRLLCGCYSSSTTVFALLSLSSILLLLFPRFTLFLGFDLRQFTWISPYFLWFLGFHLTFEAILAFSRLLLLKDLIFGWVSAAF